MNELKVFTNEECGEIRAMKRDGEAWFVAVDVCKALEIGNPSQAVKRLEVMMINAKARLMKEQNKRIELRR